MAALELRVTSDLPRILQWTRQLSHEMRPRVADAMTASARAAERAIKAQAPNKINSPTRWTMNSVFVKPANARNLAIAVGFKDYAVKGTPAAKYLEPIATGKARTTKGFERLLQKSGIINSNQYAIPTGAYPLKLDSYGNIPGSKYVQVLSRLKALGQQGYTANATNTKRSQSKRASADFFAGTPGGARGIFGRVGPKPKGNPGGIGRPVTTGLKRGFHTVFSVTNVQPKYRLNFNTGLILEKTFENVYKTQLSKILGN